MTKHGTHIIADFYGCELSSPIFRDRNKLKKLFSKLIKKHKLKELGSYYHFFRNHSFTAVIAISESHISVHTWPEDAYVSIDIFACNYSQNNSKNANNLLKDFRAVFLPKKVIKKVVKR